jgi:rhodanese-related sulfurtransferase
MRNARVVIPVFGALALAMLAGVRAPAQELTPPRTTMAEFKKLVADDNVIVLDVRDADAYRQGHIPGAILVPLNTVQTRAGEWKTATKPIVTYCS